MIYLTKTSHPVVNNDEPIFPWDIAAENQQSIGQLPKKPTKPPQNKKAEIANSSQPQTAAFGWEGTEDYNAPPKPKPLENTSDLINNNTSSEQSRPYKPKKEQARVFPAKDPNDNDGDNDWIPVEHRCVTWSL